MVILLTLFSTVHTLSANIYCHDKIDLVFALSREILYGLTVDQSESSFGCYISLLVYFSTAAIQQGRRQGMYVALTRVSECLQNIRIKLNVV